MNVPSDREQTEERAAHWVLREDRGLAAQDLIALAGWLEESTANRLAYLRLKAGWQRMEKLAAMRNGECAELSAGRGNAKWRVCRAKPWRRGLAIAASILIAIAGGTGLFLYFGVPASVITYTTWKDERPVLHLPDGTKIQLNADTRVQANVTHGVRTVTLYRGEAYFEVVHDPARPFVVNVGNRRITDIGTKFSVRRDGDDIKVIVTEGQVKVDILGTPAATTPVFVNSGNEVLVRADQALVAPESLKDIDAALAWRAGVLTFDQDTLGDAANQFNRYNLRQIVVEGDARSIRIGGSFRGDNIDVFASLVQKALGLTVRYEDDRIIISK